MEWNHAICEPCWRIREGVNRMPVRAITGEVHQCCFCALPTNGGIFVRRDPKGTELRCREQEDWHEALLTEDANA